MRDLLRILVLATLLPATATAREAPVIDGETIYQARCSGCHEGQAERAPRRDAFQAFDPESVVRALVSGPMSGQGRALTQAEMRAVAVFLTGAEFAASPLPEKAWCTERSVSFDRAKSLPSWQGWGNGVANHRFQPAAAAKLAASDVPRLKLKWAFAIPGVIRAYAQPAIVAGTAFFGTAADEVYALDAQTGCIRWRFGADAGVRSAIQVAEVGGRWLAFFGDLRGQFYALDAKSGAPVWKLAVETHRMAYITAGAALHEGRLYVGTASREETALDAEHACCTFRGSVSAIDAASGKLLWKRHTIDEPRPRMDDGTGRGFMLWGPAGGAVWATPTVDPVRRLLYVATGNAYSGPEPKTTNALMAMDLADGAIRWVQQMSTNDVGTIPCQTPGQKQACKSGAPDHDFGSSAVLLTLSGGKRVLAAGQKSGIVHGVDPDQGGRILWQTRIGKGGYEGGIEFGMASDGKLIYAPLSDFRFTGAAKTEPGAQPSIFGMKMKVDPAEGGGLFALDPATGAIKWNAPPADCQGRDGCSPAQTAAASVIPGVVFSGAIDGHLRAYSTADGRVLWDFDTIRDYDAVNGIPGKGGAIDGPGPVIADGVVYTNSGYGYVGEVAGNVLLAFSVDGK